MTQGTPESNARMWLQTAANAALAEPWRRHAAVALVKSIHENGLRLRAKTPSPGATRAIKRIEQIIAHAMSPVARPAERQTYASSAAELMRKNGLEPYGPPRIAPRMPPATRHPSRPTIRQKRETPPVGPIEVVRRELERSAAIEQEYRRARAENDATTKQLIELAGQILSKLMAS